jgi:DNA repair exonuclease SbcCD ATPase subunit
VRIRRKRKLSKIKRLVTRQALGLEEYSVNFGNVNIISGGNAKGKTSILEIIEKALYNTDRRDKFVRTGADKAFIEIETDDGMKVERTVVEDGSSSVKVTRDGIPVRAPQTFLDQLLGVSKERKDVFAFNPVDFMLKSAKDQSKIILSMIPFYVTQADMMQWFGKVPPVNPNMHGLLVLKELEKYWYDARHEANGAVRATQAEVEALQKQLPDNYQVEEWENFSTMALSDEIRKGEQTNNFRKQGQDLIDGLEATKQTINNKYDLQVKEQEELLEFKIGKAKQGIEAQKQTIQEEINSLGIQISQHDIRIKELLQEIENEKGKIKDIEQEIKLKQKDLDNFDNSILTTKTESLTNEMNTAINAINENRQRELNEAAERVVKAEKYLADNPEVDIKPLEDKYAEAEKMKGFVEMAHNLQNIMQRMQKETELAEKYDNFVELCRKKPAELLKTIELPVKGLAIETIKDGEKEENIVVFDGQTLKNHNTAKQVTICIDIAKAYAKDNPMKLLCVDKIEHLDATARQEFFKQIEADEEYQYFVTWVTDGDMNVKTVGQV